MAGRVLLVEDNPDDELLMKRALAQGGFRAPIYVAHDGDLAVQYLSGSGLFSDRSRYPNPSHMFLDLNIPGTPGLEVLRWVRSEGPVRSLPVVVLTGSEADRDLETARRLGADGYLVKPSDPEGLAYVAKSLLDWVVLGRPPGYPVKSA